MDKREWEEYEQLCKRDDLDNDLDNHYKVLMIAPFSEFDEERSKKLKRKVRAELTSYNKELVTKLAEKIGDAERALKIAPKKKEYDTKLRKKFQKDLCDLIDVFVIKDNELDSEEISDVEDKGRRLGLSAAEIDKIIKEQQSLLGFEMPLPGEERSSNAGTGSASSASTPAGSPILDIECADLLAGTLVFEDIALGGSSSKTFIIKNGGGGTLDAEITWTQKWLDVVPTKVHQSDLPKEVTVTVLPRNDTSLSNGALVVDVLKFSYGSAGGPKKQPVKLSIEGIDELVEKRARWASLLSGVLVLLSLISLGSSGATDFLSIGGIILGAVLLPFWPIGTLLGALILFGNLSAGLTFFFQFFVLIAVVPMTYFLAHFIWRARTFHDSHIALIPFACCLPYLFIFGFPIETQSGFSSDHEAKTLNPTVISTTSKAPSSSNIKRENHQSPRPAIPMVERRRETTTSVKPSISVPDTLPTSRSKNPVVKAEELFTAKNSIEMDINRERSDGRLSSSKSETKSTVKEASSTSSTRKQKENPDRDRNKDHLFDPPSVDF